MNVRRLFDHVPVQVALSYSLDHTGFSQGAEERLNRDQLRKCITHGEKRVELVQAVTSELESLSEVMDRQFREKTPDAVVVTFTSALMNAAKAVFGVMQGGRTAEQKVEAKQLAALLRQRRALRQRLHGCSEGADLALTMEIVRLSRQLRRMARVQRDQRRRFLEEELATAWKQGLWYDVGKVARLLSCKGLGARKRVYGHLASTQPTVSMRVDKLKLPGKEGGCAAVEITMEEVRAAAQREGAPQPVEGGDRVAAIEDLKGFLKAVLKLRNHKAFPPGSVPAELLKAVLFPSWLHRDRSKPGVGAPTMQATLSKLSSFPVRNCVRKIFRMIRATQRSPVTWHSAQAAYVSKHNGKAWTEGERVVMVMCPFGRAFHRSILQRGLAASPLTYSPWTFGSIPGRRREEAILLQLVTSWRLRRAGISHVTRMHDGVNAFLSVRQPYIVDAARPPFVEKEMDHELLRQHVQQATVRVGQGNEARTLLAREGAWPGDYAVPLLFVRGAMAAYDGEPAHTRARRVLRSLSPLTGQEFCFDKTGYVDDVAGKAVGALTAAAEQAVVKYEQHIARARAVSLDEGANVFFPRVFFPRVRVRRTRGLVLGWTRRSRRSARARIGARFVS